MSLEVFACAMCGQCCEGEGGIVLSRKDAARLAEHFGMAVEAFLAQYAMVQGGKHHLASNGQGACVFYEKDRGCAVHPARPDVCRAWPFFRGNLVDAGSLAMAKEDCKGIRRDVTFAEFRSSGVAYLREKGLVSSDPDAGNALNLDFSEADGADKG
ncbi:YkgJ family cysteine cluster protein [Oceanidesulfovibrio marinus]|uniref:YkgJ family cysteine cluster protein n=1 Tax=Oceanidesulfovibrio marinus TaxID=370038 RepID=A0A6P1ZFB8_9BACT|nr:YkgJ family cysteine cluster protein [Oceanidesulfovibrio marinus]TVM33332.1 YkgJ family cysteine cluster protein [Oceanidesulfovibrio marinus]